MKTTKVLQTNISETSVSEVSNILNSSTTQRVAICNANTLVRSVKNSLIKETINNFTIRTPDGFPVAKALSIISKQKFPRVDGYNVFLQTIEDGLSKNSSHYFFGSNEYITKLMINNLKKGNKDENSILINKLQQGTIDNNNIFKLLMDISKKCSLGDITNALFEVGGEYRRNM